MQGYVAHQRSFVLLSRQNSPIYYQKWFAPFDQLVLSISLDDPIFFHDLFFLIWNTKPPDYYTSSACPKTT